MDRLPAAIVPVSLLFLLSLLLPCLPAVAGPYDRDLPHSEISIEALERSYPRLQKMLQLRKLRFGRPIFIRIFKETSELELWIRADNGIFKHFKTYSICYNSGGLGPKIQEGDHQSPEGFYQVTSEQMNPWSNYHLAFNLGYPNEYDQSHNRTGAALMVHGRCSSIGCFAMTDYYMDEIYTLAEAALAHGQGGFQVHIFPFRLTGENLASHTHSKWYSFWLNLKAGFDFFESHHYPPEVSVWNKRYVFNIMERSIADASASSPMKQPATTEASD